MDFSMPQRKLCRRLILLVGLMTESGSPLYAGGCSRAHAYWAAVWGCWRLPWERRRAWRV